MIGRLGEMVATAPSYRAVGIMPANENSPREELKQRLVFN